MPKGSLLTKKWMILLLAAVSTMLWGSAFPAIKKGYELFGINGADTASKLLFAGVRFTLAGLLVLLVFSAVYRKAPLLKKADFRPVLTLGIFQTVIQYIFFYIGVSNTTGTKSSILSAFSAFIVVLIAPFFYRTDKLSWQKLAGCALGLAGIVLINLDGGGFAGFRLDGEGFVLLSSISAAVAFFLSKSVAQGRNVMLVTGSQLFLGGIILTAVGLAFGGTLRFHGISCVFSMGYLALLSSVAFTLWTALLSKNSVSEVSIYNLLTPLFGTILSGLVLKENIATWTNLLSVLLVCSGIGFVNYTRKNPKIN